MQTLIIIATSVLVTLKLLGHITISWLWVFSPLWIPFALAAVLLLGAYIYDKIKGGY